MKNFVALYNSKTKHPSDLPKLFCCSNSDLIKGIVVEAKGSDIERQLVIIDNPDNLELKELLKKLLIGYDKNIVMNSINDDILLSSFFIPIQDYRNELYQEMKERKKENLKRYSIRRKYESNNHILTKKEINELYEYLDLPKVKGINKADYLEFYLYFGNNLKIYKSFKNLKDQADVSWRDFRKIKFSDIDMEKKIIRFGHSISSITKETYTSR